MIYLLLFSKTIILYYSLFSKKIFLTKLHVIFILKFCFEVSSSSRIKIIFKYLKKTTNLYIILFFSL